jgi:deoxyribonuclease-4
MLFGTHISSAGGVQNAPKNAAQAECEVFQFFSRSPQGGKAPVLGVREVAGFKENCKRYKQAESYIHAPYYINLASAKNNIYYASISVLREELERGSLLGAKYLMAHLGSAKEMSRRDAINRVSAGIEKILAGYKGSTELLIEMSAGAGEIMGDSLEEVAEIIKLAEKKLKPAQTKRGQYKELARHSSEPEMGSEGGQVIGVCVDTAHAFASGYDLRDKKAVKKFLDEFDKKIGLKKLKLIHTNDSLYGLASRKDRHAHLGEGKIGRAGFTALVQEPRLKKINFILETPTEEGALRDIRLLKKLRSKVVRK